ncbi:MAG: polymer-forming cytoskeletal protein [Hyphomicrobiales bacterium]|nr:polymer-forming cytoskeletal protein [Hyphomicrobiales bacterium]
MPPSFIGEGLRLAGDLRTEESLQVDGEIEGDVQCSSLVLGERGRIDGSVVAGDVDVLGQVQGAISGQRVRLRAGAHVAADIRYQTLVIEQGAAFEGRAQRLPSAEASAQDEAPEASAPPEQNEKSVA